MKEVLAWHGLWPVSFPESDNGRAMDACHVIGFGEDLGSSVLPVSLFGLPQTVWHFLNGGVSGSFPASAWVTQASVSPVIDPPRKVLWHDDVVLGKGLFPCSQQLLLVLCPSHFFPRQWI